MVEYERNGSLVIETGKIVTEFKLSPLGYQGESDLVKRARLDNNVIFANGDRNIATEWTPSPLDNITAVKIEANAIYLKDVINSENVNSINIHSFKNPN